MFIVRMVYYSRLQINRPGDACVIRAVVTIPTDLPALKAQTNIELTSLLTSLDSLHFVYIA